MLARMCVDKRDWDEGGMGTGDGEGGGGRGGVYDDLLLWVLHNVTEHRHPSIMISHGITLNVEMCRNASGKTTNNACEDFLM